MSSNVEGSGESSKENVEQVKKKLQKMLLNEQLENAMTFQDEVPIWFEKKVDCVSKEKHVDKEIHKRITFVTRTSVKKCVDGEMLAYQEASLMLLPHEPKEKIEVSQIEAVKSSSEEDQTRSKARKIRKRFLARRARRQRIWRSHHRQTRKRRQGKKSKKKARSTKR